MAKYSKDRVLSAADREIEIIENDDSLTDVEKADAIHEIERDVSEVLRECGDDDECEF